MGTENQEYTERLLQADVWWKRLLDAQRPYRIHLQRLGLGSVLDIGCGVGRNLVNIGARGKSIGVDHNPHSVAIARSRGLLAFTPEEFRASSYAEPSSFDSILLSHVAEHMSRKEVVSLINEYIPYLRFRGRIVIITPQEAGHRSDPTHVEFMDFGAVADIFKEADLSLLRQYSFPFPRIFGRVFKYNEFVTIGQKE
ncbi:MAG TPA: class I SAM-dependent methyltransferase [Blastocatellia bacterium]|nr:class I SAM-dependent methyltransferase [Blastocatellia bacterium]